SFATSRAGGFFYLFTFIMLPSWLISYVASFVKACKLRSTYPLYRTFIVFQAITLFVFFISIPVSYIIPREVPFNVRTVQR
ncbi:MAG: hypothetical protein AB1650_09925, partial [Candidatus Omnitrophota bacterium]